MHAVVAQFGNAEYLGLRVSLAKLTELRDKVIEPCTFNFDPFVGNDDNVVSDVRQLAVTNSTGSSFRIRFID